MRGKISAVGIDQRLADRQPQPQPAELARHAGRTLFESLEQFGKCFGIQSDAGIGDAQSELIVFTARADRDGAAVRRKLDGVLEQIPQHLLKPGRIGGHIAALRFQFAA